MAQIIYHDKSDKSFKKNYLLKTHKQRYYLITLSVILGVSVTLNIFLFLHR